MSTLFRIPEVQGVTKATAKQQMLKQLVCTNAPEQALRYHGFRTIAGVDEVGRGALFGPVVAAAVILPEKVGVVAVEAETIDRINIYQASRLAMRLACEQLTVTPDHLIIDALHIDYPCQQTKLYYGDALCLSIAAASVIAKVYRDALCRELDKQFPQYGLASHKGYATPEHRKALKEHGPCPLHRRSFAPVLAADPEAALDTQLDLDDMFDELPPEELASDELVAAEIAPGGTSTDDPVNVLSV